MGDEMSKERVIRRLTIRSFHVTSVELGPNPGLNKEVLTLDISLIKQIVESDSRVKDISINIIPPKSQAPERHDVEINTIMDIIPISTKVIGSIGEGVTHTLTGVSVMLTGCDENGKQMAEFGSSEGILSEQMVLGQAGTPSENDFIVHIDVTLVQEDEADRSQPMAAFRACDQFIQSIRQPLKKINGRLATENHIFEDKVRPEKKKVLIIKQVAGQGAMYDNMLFSDEPSGFAGGRSIIDVGNVPIILSPNEYRDGALRAMT